MSLFFLLESMNAENLLLRSRVVRANNLDQSQQSPDMLGVASQTVHPALKSQGRLSNLRRPIRALA